MTGLSEYQAARALGVKPQTLAKARSAGVVLPRSAGRSFIYSDADLVAFRASRAGLHQKQVAAMLGVPSSWVGWARSLGFISAKRIGRNRFVYDAAEVARLAARG